MASISMNRISSICQCSCKACTNRAGLIILPVDAGSVRVLASLMASRSSTRRGLFSWSFRRPLAADSLLDPELSEWENTAVPVTLTFDRTQMVSAIETYLDTVRTLVGDESSKFGWPVYGLSVQDVLKIDPRKPFYAIRNED